MLLTILSKGNIDVKTNSNLLTDFANVLSMTGNNIVSADVPAAMRSLAKSIKEPQVFKQMTPEEALQWLENNTEESGQLYKEFIKNFGFRGYKEWDIMSITWSGNKQMLVTTLQMMVPLKENSNQVILTKDELISRIKTPITRNQKYLLKNWILPACQRSVADREESKLFDIKCVDKFRQLLNKMGEMMSYREGRLPEPDLVFFLTLHELNVLTQTRDPKIVMKAKQRKKIYPKLDKYIYDEMSIGPNIKPRNFVDKKLEAEKYLNGENDILKGTPVCTGSIKAKACVCKCFEDAKNLESGDILITYSTDIGWSPYLPMIGGIITEIGGLVSHGAVIAREYGIPCLVGVENACHSITNGQTILLDADNGCVVLMTAQDN
ncbi:unnamed protein product [Oppiella nova]|uniref:PEP-utilising enzyme mobile domain-containing protein n=1 Tax=Oppiella nova TaxID=334625 RepID=A0A7R9MHA5_9ACAR|nr:unnamed protein product [Oppiella nova]CAG2177381.1 unnamed protein product [Oppiella nova]